MLRAEFVHFYEMPVRWGDADILGHINNAKYFQYLECGRIAYCEEVLALRFQPGIRQGWILAAINCTFHRQLLYPTTIEVGTRVSRFGASSATISAAIFENGSDRLIASSEATTVWFDYVRQASCQIPEDVRARVRKFEKTAPAEG